MDNRKLSRLGLLTNLICLTAGIFVYSSVAPPKAIVSTILWSLAVLAATYFCSILVTRHLRENPVAVNSEGPIVSPTVVKIVIIVPVVLTMYEILALLGMGAEPQAVSWVHMVVAGAAGQNAEEIFRKD